MSDFFGITDKDQLEKVKVILDMFNRNDDEEKERMLKILGGLIE